MDCSGTVKYRVGRQVSQGSCNFGRDCEISGVSDELKFGKL